MKNILKKPTYINIEIERKFLVSGNFKNIADGKFTIKQGYISTDPERTVRIRITDKKGFITIKGKSDISGMSRLEWEREISIHEAESLLKLSKAHPIEKVRYVVEHGNHIIEVDEFFGANQGLIVAEIELSSANEAIDLPEWLGTEVTNDKRYYNSYLSEHPFTVWNKNN